MFLHNTALGKWLSKTFETNSINPIDFKISHTIQPTVNVEPDVIYRQATSNGTMFVTPTDKEFYLTSVSAMCYNDSTPTNGSAVITFVTEDEQTRQFTISTGQWTASDDSISHSVQFPKRGLLLKKGSNITASVTLGTCQIVGYYASDRA